VSDLSVQSPRLPFTRICVDGANIAIPKGSGIATYGHNLLGAIRAIGAAPEVLFGPSTLRSRDPLVNLAAIADGPPHRGKIDKNRRWRRTLTSFLGRTAFAVPPSPEVIWSTRGSGKPDADLFWSCPDLFTLSQRAFDRFDVVTPVRFEGAEQPGPRIMHWTCPMPVYSPGRLNVVTVHDIIPLRLPHTTLDDKVAYAKRLRASLDRSDHIVVVSEQTRRDLIEWVGLDEQRITNTYQAVSVPAEARGRAAASVVEEVERVLGLGWRGYYLYFGAVEPKKNLARLIQAHLASGVTSPLVIVGGRGWLNEDENGFLADIAGRPGGERIRRFEYMPYPLLVSLIRGARAVLFPSLYEGFGLPVLEAMCLGTPVLTSTQGSLPEVAGDAAIFVDAYDIDSIKAGILLLDSDDATRDELALKGSLQARKFSTEAYHLSIDKLYRSLA